MRIRSVEAIPVSLARDRAQAKGTAGSPTELAAGAGAVRWSSTVPAVYSERFETALVRITLDDGRIGWGEAQAPVAPRVACAIIDDILRPVLEAEDAFDGSRASIEHLWSRMFQSMRVRGQTGGFMMDAISGCDIALWDLAGQIAGLPVARLLNPQAPLTVPAYLSGLAGATLAERVAFARRYAADGVTAVKIFYDAGEQALLDTIDALREGLGREVRIAVDALWRLEWPSSRPLLDQLAGRSLWWLEAPFQPDEPEPHRELARAYPDLPLALGESYRTRREMSWFLDEGLVRFVQPDLGRSGITESARIAAAGVTLVPHVSIAMAPQIAAAIHTAAAFAPVCEFNPNVFTVANQYVTTPLAVNRAHYQVPAGAGLGLSMVGF